VACAPVSAAARWSIGGSTRTAPETWAITLSTTLALTGVGAHELSKLQVTPALLEKQVLRLERVGTKNASAVYAWTVFGRDSCAGAVGSRTFLMWSCGNLRLGEWRIFLAASDGPLSAAFRAAPFENDVRALDALLEFDGACSFALHARGRKAEDDRRILHKRVGTDPTLNSAVWRL
jgi:hypothetical protein